MRPREDCRALSPPLFVFAFLLVATVVRVPAPAAEDGLTACFGENPTIVGTPGNDRLVGTPANDVIVGLGGDDSIDGRGGNDLICGDDGDDRLSGGRGDDLMTAGPGDDVLSGGAGNDGLDGELGSDALDGGSGNDRIDGGSGDEEVPNTGDDALIGGPGDDMLTGGFGSDVLSGGPGADTLTVIGDNGASMSGGSGDDQLSGGEGDDRMEGNEGDDQLSGGPGDDVVAGGPGNDELSGDDGDDQLSGGPGADRLLGGNGDDTLSGGPGDDLALGGPGVDQLVDETEPPLTDLIELGDRELIRQWAEDQTITQINDAVAVLDDDQRGRVAEVLLDTNANSIERDKLLRTMRLVLAQPDLGFYAEIWSYTRIEMTPGGFFGGCGIILLDPPAFDGLSELDTRNVVMAETFHSFDCMNGGPVGSLDEGSSGWVIVAGFPRPLTPGESWAEATYGTKLARRDIDHQPDYPLSAPLDPTTRLLEVYGWLSAHDPSKLPWNSQERLVGCYQRYYEQLDRDVDFQTEWLPAVAAATENMVADRECKPV